MVELDNASERERNELEECKETRISEDQLAEIRLKEADSSAEFLGIKKKIAIS